MPGEQRGSAVGNSSNKMGGRDEMTKASINLRDLRRRIYVEAKADSAGTDEVESGCTKREIKVRYYQEPKVLPAR